jgi:hypothetical protein
MDGEFKDRQIQDAKGREPEGSSYHDPPSGLRERKKTTGGGQWLLSLGILTGQCSHPDQGMICLHIRMDKGQQVRGIILDMSADFF